MEFTNHVVNSKIDIECRLNRFAPGDLVHVWMRAFDLARASIDLVAFATGCGLTVVLDTWVDPNGLKSRINPGDPPNLAPLCTAFTLTKDFDEVHQLVLSDPGFFMALNDLVNAIIYPHVSSVNCARCIEGLRHLIAAPGSTDKQAWEQMRQVLHIDRAYLQLITDTSTKPRHGDRIRVSGAVTTEITRRSWIIMNRYLEFRKRGSKPLPSTEFPLLVG
jgi:hypothetical protein